MAEYIERGATLNLLRSLGSRDYRREKGTIQDAMKMVSFNEYTPAADVAPVVHGRWIRIDPHDEESSVMCSVCGETFDYIDGVCYLVRGSKMRPIDADELLKLYEGFDDPHYSVPVPVILANIADMPTINDVVPIAHAHWVSLTNCSNEGLYCSNCHKKVYKGDYAIANKRNKVRSKYCPNCGALMDESEVAHDEQSASIL